MPNVFKSTGSQSIGTTTTTVYTAPAATTTTIIGVGVANRLTDGSVVEIDVIISKGGGGTGSGTETYVIRGAPVVSGSTIVPVGGDQKLVLETGNLLRVRSNVASSVDVIVSVLEIS
jgi:hypothetical protein